MENDADPVEVGAFEVGQLAKTFHGSYVSGRQPGPGPSLLSPRAKELAGQPRQPHLDREARHSPMKAIVFDPSAPRNFAFGEVPAPAPAAPNELLIEVKAISLNFGEVSTVDNVESPGDVPGWDSAGVVLVPAANGSGPPAGARVVGADWSRAWAEQRVLTSDNVAVVPESLDFETAAALSVAGVTARQIVRRLGAVVGRRVLITGASGGVGRLAVQLAARAGAHVVAAVGSAERGAGLRRLGAQEVVVGLADVAPVYGALEHVGGQTLAAAFGLLEDGGTVISVGAASGEPTAGSPGYCNGCLATPSSPPPASRPARATRSTTCRRTWPSNQWPHPDTPPSSSAYSSGQTVAP